MSILSLLLCYSALCSSPPLLLSSQRLRNTQISGTVPEMPLPTYLPRYLTLFVGRYLGYSRDPRHAPDFHSTALLSAHPTCRTPNKLAPSSLSPHAFRRSRPPEPPLGMARFWPVASRGSCSHTAVFASTSNFLTTNPWVSPCLHVSQAYMYCTLGSCLENTPTSPIRALLLGDTTSRGPGAQSMQGERQTRPRDAAVDRDHQIREGPDSNACSVACGAAGISLSPLRPLPFPVQPRVSRVQPQVSRGHGLHVTF